MHGSNDGLSAHWEDEHLAEPDYCYGALAGRLPHEGGNGWSRSPEIPESPEDADR